MEWFDALNIQKIHREMNGLVDKFQVVASTLQPSDEMISGNGKMEINFRPSISDNIDLGSPVYTLIIFQAQETTNEKEPPLESYSCFHTL